MSWNQPQDEQKWPAVVGGAPSPDVGTRKTLPPLTRNAGEGAPPSEVSLLFAGIIYENRTNAAHILADYHFHQPYVANSSYSSRPHLLFYEGLHHTYASYLCIVGSEWYVVERRIETETTLLARHCPCWHCLMASSNPLRYLYTRYHAGCLLIDPHNQILLKEARLRQVGEGNPYLVIYVRLLEWATLIFLFWWWR